jgi:hypothetical protein
MIILPRVRAIDVKITSITPVTHHGKVGDTVRIIGTTNTTNGQYQIWFDRYKVQEANSTGNNVNATFSVPKLPKGNYTVTLQDVSINVNATSWFYIDPAFYIEAKKPALPAQLQEGSTVEIWINVTGGEANTIYSANITVKTPANETYWTLVMLTNTTNVGEGYNITVVYPTHFHGAPHTNYTGTYTVAFNKTLATNTFFIGLTDRTEYHRNQLVDIKAAGYKPNENATAKISFGGKTIDSNNATATNEGLIAVNWTVPSNASIGTYTLNITSTSLNPTRKNPQDVQGFIVPGFDINITTRNLAEETVSNVAVRVFENEKSILNDTSTSDGLVQMTLEIGNYVCRAFYNWQKVGERWVNITGITAPLNLFCNLTNLKILITAIFNGVELGVPEAEIYLKPLNQTLTTNITGIAVAHSLLPNVSYVLNASRYGVSFAVTSIPTLLVNQVVTAWYNVTFICPTLTLRVNVTNANGDPISGVTVKVQELMGGLLYEGSTNLEGMSVFDCVFGNYTVGVYNVEGIRLNETAIDLFQNQNISISCKLYGLIVSVRVVDYFGQPISNANVTMQREGLAPRSQNTQSNGIATFDRITGGDLQIAVYLSDQTHPSMEEEFTIESSTTIVIKLERYVILAGLLIETSLLTTTIIIAVAALLVVLMEVYRRRHLKPQKSSS